MKWFIDLRTRDKLFVSFGLMIVLLLVVLVTAYKDLVHLQRSLKDIYEVEFANVSDLKDVRFNQDRIRSYSLTMMLTKDRQRLDSLKNSGDELMGKNDELMGMLIKREKNEKHIALLKQFDEVRRVFNETRKNEVIPLMYAGKLDKAKNVVGGVQAERNEKMAVTGNELVAAAENAVGAAVAESSRAVATATNILVIIGIASVILAITVAAYLSRIIAGPLKEIAAGAGKIAAGDLTITLPAGNRTDEVGRLAQNFTEMVRGLRSLNGEIQESVNVLASSASEILASTTEATAGMAETMTSVSETTVTVEEVKQTAQLSAEKSRSVSEGAQKASLVAQQGSDAVAKTVGGISHIEKLMETVAESIVKLSEQGQAIGEIMAVVGDLAQQSNLLAVNAAIEASKAGEHGKGFTVVAQEIKSLANQSKQATEQVRAILGDIQRATGASVLAAEQVSKAVDEGVKQSAESGASIRRLAESIAESAQAATQIAASCQEQFAGMDQIAIAMESIKEAADQNVSGMRHAEDAAHSLNDLGQKLKELVAKYKV